MERRRKSASSFFSLLLLFPPPSSLSLNIFPFYSFSRQKPDKRNLSHLLLPPFKSTQSSSSVRGSKRNRRTLSTTDVSLPLSLPSSSFTSSSSLRQTLFSSSPPPSLFSSPFLSSSSSLLLSPRRNSLSSHNPARYTPSRLSPCRSLWHSLLSSSSSSLQSITSSLLPSFSPSSSSSPSDLDLPPYPSSSSSSSSRQERSSSSPSSSALTHHERRVIAACASEYFQVVRDVQFYQDFIPWCQESRILTETVVVEEKNAEEKKEKTKEGEEEEDFHERKKDEKRRIIEMFEAELVIGFSFITDRYTSKVYLKRPPNSSSSSSSLLLPSSSIPSIPSSSSFSSFSSSPSVGWDYEVSVVAADSTVFNTLVNEWRFRRIDSRSPPPKGGEVPGSPSSSSSCLVDFFIEFELKNSIHQNLARIFLKDVASTMSRGFDARVASLRGSSSSLSSSFLSPSDVSFFERRQKREDTEREEKNMIKRMKMKKEDLSDLEVSKTKDTGEVYLEGEKGKEKHMTCLTPLSSSSPCNERERKKKELGENLGDRQHRDSSSSSPLFSSSPFSLPSYSSSLSLSSPVSSEVPSSASQEETFPSAVSLKSTGEKSLLTLSPPREEDKEEEEQTSEKDRVVSSLSSHSPRSENLVRRRKRRESIDRSSKVCREHLHKLKDEESPAIQGLQESKPLEEDEEEKDKKKRKMRKRASSFLSSSLSPLPEIASVMALSEEAVERNSLSPLELAHLLRLIDSLSLLDLPLPKHRHVLNSQQLAGQRSWLATPHDHPELAMRRQSRSSSIPVNRHRHSGLPFTRGDRIGRRRRQKTTSSCIVFSSSPSHRYSCDGEEHAEDLPLVLLSYEERCDLQSLLLLGDGEIRKAILACFLAYSSSSSLSSSPLSSFRSFHPHQQHDWRSFFLTLPSFLSKKERRKEMTNDMSSDLPACEGKTGSKEQAKEKKKEETNPFPRDNEEKKASKTRERNFFRSFFSSFNVRKRESENSRRGDSEIGPSQRNGNLEKEDEDEEQKKKKEERTIFGKPYEAAGLHGERRGEQEEVVEEEEERGSRRRRKEKIRERIERRKDEDRGSTLRLPQSQSGEKRRKEEIEEEERMSEGVDKKLFLSIQKRYVPLLLQGLRGILEEGKRRKRGRIKTR